MPMYLVITPVRNGGPEPIASGETVELSKRDGDDLVAIGAVELALGVAAAPPPPPPPPPPPAVKPLVKMNRGELLAVAVAEQLPPFADDATKAVIIAAIETKRTEAGA